MTPLIKYFAFGGKWNGEHPDPVSNRKRYRLITVKVESVCGTLYYTINPYDINQLDNLTKELVEILNVEVLEKY